MPSHLWSGFACLEFSISAKTEGGLSLYKTTTTRRPILSTFVAPARKYWSPRNSTTPSIRKPTASGTRKSYTKTIAKIEAAIETVYKEGEAKLKDNGKSVPALSVIKPPLRDGDMERPDAPAYANAYFVNANATPLILIKAEPLFSHCFSYQ